MKADTNYGADSSASSSNGFEGKLKMKRRSDYDRDQMDVAVELVLKNKLSLRAASHIYKIPFSSLRTRKILVSNNPQLLKIKSKTQTKYNDEDDEYEYEDMDNAEDFEEECEEAVDDLAVKKENLNVVSSSSKPLTLHAFKKSGMADLKNPKTEAFLAALSNNSKRAAKFNNNKLKVKLNMNRNVSKFASGRITKPTNKRHYLKQDRLQEAVEANGFHDDGSDILDENTNSDNQQSQDEQAESPQEQDETFKSKSPLATNTTVTQNPCRSNVSPIKLSSLFSNSVLAMNKKNRRFPSKPNPILRSVSVAQKATSQITQNTNSSNDTGKEDTATTSMFDSLQKYLIESKQTTKSSNVNEQADNKSSSLYKCNNCKLIFVDLRLLKEHASSTCDYVIKYEQVETISLRELIAQTLKEKKLFTCSFCKQTYPSKLSLLSHGITCNRQSVNLDVTI